ncbi:uncharacterized protein MONBRDRAFT_5213 [Monosiga brevicollis MX1]|uniref:EF-hand domain-containing protein n=1 Tax=Monosiga brevicollis TaxID=81824 RepID=A9UQ97_MONBE|nr:uncharacterized protein MONBRDRAFT_5213 [Monosiga brevicollis MX1]EDQ92558.1 predicted protein [Monosiga brevicollis MX1]|eukprot:XP_001742320.1 hypothetical protein [Monosiga brevicollis MX1]
MYTTVSLDMVESLTSTPPARLTSHGAHHRDSDTSRQALRQSFPPDLRRLPPVGGTPPPPAALGSPDPKNRDRSSLGPIPSRARGLPPLDLRGRRSLDSVSRQTSVSYSDGNAVPSPSPKSFQSPAAHRHRRNSRRSSLEPLTNHSVYRLTGQRVSNCRVIRVGGGYLILSNEMNALYTDRELRKRLTKNSFVPRGLNVVEAAANGTLRLVDGSTLLPDGSRLFRDGTVVAPPAPDDSDDLFGVLTAADEVPPDTDPTDSSEPEPEPRSTASEPPSVVLTMPVLGPESTSPDEDGPDALNLDTTGSAITDDTVAFAPVPPSATSELDDSSHVERFGSTGRGRRQRRPLEWQFDQEVRETLADGTRVLADGTHITPTGRMVLADGTELSEEESRDLALRRKHGVHRIKPATSTEPLPEEEDTSGASQAGIESDHDPSHGATAARRRLSVMPEHVAMEADADPSFVHPDVMVAPVTVAGIDGIDAIHGIDALDYLAKYCILQPGQEAAYRSVFESLAVREDDTIGVLELDLGLKTINRELITDGEVTYVHTVLDLGKGRSINFRYFSVIAALSQRVASLDRMVKGLINALDVEALAVKIEKCKELFYLLDERRAGSVSLDDLSHELRAGRISEIHERLVLDKFGEGGRTEADFLDFLAYIPLFLEIHDTINDNPFDLNRDK